MLVQHRCSSGEERLNIPEGVLKRVVKTIEQKEKDLEAVMLLLFYNHILC